MMVLLSDEELVGSERYICKNSSIYFSCVLKNEAKGVAWGNRKLKPDFFMVWSSYQEGFQLMGKVLPKEEWKDFRIWFDATIIPFLKGQGLDYFEYGADSKELADMLQSIFSDTKIFSEQHKLFYWHGTEIKLPPPEGFQFKKVDEAFLKELYLNKESIINELQNAYGDIELHNKKGVVYAAIYESRVVARAAMLFIDNGYGNISVNTEEQYRRNGLSSYLVMKTIEDTLSLGLKPIWDCSEDNLASEKTAIKCGFKLIQKDIIFWFMLKDS